MEDYRKCKKCGDIKSLDNFYNNQYYCKNCQKEYSKYRNTLEKQDNILVIGDLHLPFLREGYLEFCREMKEKHKCNKIIQIGDILDFHYSSYFNFTFLQNI